MPFIHTLTIIMEPYTHNHHWYAKEHSKTMGNPENKSLKQI